MYDETEGYVKIEFEKDGEDYCWYRSNHDKDDVVESLIRDGAERITVTEEIF